MNSDKPFLEMGMSSGLGFLAGGGAASRLILDRDWTGHPLGAPETWPCGLKTALSLILNSPESMILAWGREELFFFFNETYFPLLGPRLPWAMGSPFTQVWADAWDQAKPIIDDAFAGEKRRFDDLPWKLATDRGDADTWWTFSYSRVLDEAGAVAGLFIFTNETTARVLADAALRESEERLRLVVEGARDHAILTTDPEGIITSWSKGAELVMGWTPEEAIGRPASLIFTPEDREAGVDVHELTTARDCGCANDERWHLTKSGSRVFMNGSVHPLARSADGAERGFIKVARDDTERWLTQRALRDLNATLEEKVAAEVDARMQTEEALRQSQKVEAIGQLTGGVAHDFNNLLTVIRGSVDLLRRPGLAEDRRARYIDAIADTADRAAKLTGQLLAFARRQALKPEVFDATANLTAIRDMIATLVGARIHVALKAPSEACFVDADTSQFDTALVNMAVNARDAMNGEGDLTFQVGTADYMPAVRSHPAVEGRFVTVAVSDTGGGIAPENLDRIFEPFFTTKGIGEGTGLGLSQVFGFAKQSGGEVHVVSELGRGTTFTLYLPRSDRGGTPGRVHSELGDLGEDHGTCVLVVEDNPDVGRFATSTLDELGYSTVYTESAAAALAELEKDAERFHVVFSDVVMPGMNGLELAKIIRARHPDLPVVLTSGYSHVLAEEGAAGFDLLRKPYSMDQLSNALMQAARRSPDGKAAGSFPANRAPA